MSTQTGMHSFADSLGRQPIDGSKLLFNARPFLCARWCLRETMLCTLPMSTYSCSRAIHPEKPLPTESVTCFVYLFVCPPTNSANGAAAGYLDHHLAAQIRCSSTTFFTAPIRHSPPFLHAASFCVRFVYPTRRCKHNIFWCIHGVLCFCVHYRIMVLSVYYECHITAGCMWYMRY